MSRYNRGRVAMGLRRSGLCLLLAALAAPAGAVEPQQGRELNACVKLAEENPGAALDRAMAWEEKGGGAYAALCHAMALFHRGQFDAAGARLEELAALFGVSDAQASAALLSRAGWAWLRAGNALRAERLYTDAIGRSPEDLDLYIDRAFARAEAERYADAIADLSHVADTNPRRADAFLYRAGAYRNLEQYDLALADVARALELSPDSADAVLLRGNLQALTGHAEAARQDWQRVIALAPDTSSARAAAANLARFEAAERNGPPAR